MPRPVHHSQAASTNQRLTTQQSVAKKRGCCEERRHADREKEETSETERSQTVSQPTSPAHQSLVFANALRDTCKKGHHRLLDPRGCIVSDDLMTITRKPQRTHCFVIGETPLKCHTGSTGKGWYFEVQIEAVIPGQSAGLGIGVTTATSSKIANLDWRARAVPESWIAGYWGQVSAVGKFQPLNWHPRNLAVKDRVGFLVCGSGDCIVYVNRTERAYIEKLVPIAPQSDQLSNFYALVDIFSCTSSVTFLDSTPPKRSIVATQEKLPAASPVAPVQSNTTAPSASAKEQPVTRQDLKDKLAKKLAGKALVRGRKPPAKGKHRDPVEVLKGRAAAEKGSVQSETTAEEPEQGLVNPVPGLTMYQTCVLARLAAEKKLRLNNTDSKLATGDDVQKLGDTKRAGNCDAEAQVSVSDPKACLSQAKPSVNSTQEAAEQVTYYESLIEAKQKEIAAITRAIEVKIAVEALSDSENEGPLKPGCKAEIGGMQYGGPLKPGRKVKLVGMKSADYLNDHVATLQSYNPRKRRWTVSVEAYSLQVSVKTENLILYDDEDDKSKAVRPIVDPDPKIDGKIGTQESLHSEVLNTDSEHCGTRTGSGVTFLPASSEAPKPALHLEIECNRDHQQSALKDKGDPCKTSSNETCEDAAYEAEVSCGRREDQHNSEQDKEALASKSGNSIKAVDPVDYAGSVTCPKHEDHEDSNFEEKEEEEASSSSQPEEEPQITNAEVIDPIGMSIEQVEPAPEASPVASPPLTFTRSADPLWLVPGVPRKCGMAGYLSVCCNGAAMYTDDDRVEVLCTEGCAAVFHAACYKCFRRPPDRSCLDTTCTGKLCRVWKTSCRGEVTNVFDLKQEPDCQLQVSSKSSSSNAKVNNSSSAYSRSTANSEPGMSADKAAKTADSQNKVSRGPAAGPAQRSGKTPVANSCSKGSASTEPGVTPVKKKQEAAHVPQAAATECFKGALTKEETMRVNVKTQVNDGIASGADSIQQPTAQVEQACVRGVPSQSLLELAARMCKTGDFMVLAAWSSRQHRGQEEPLRVPKGGVVYVSRVDEQGWALATCRLTGNSGWLPYNFLCRVIYTASQKFSNSIGGYSVIAKGELASVFHREGCWVYGAVLASPAKEFRDGAGEEDQWKEVGWYPADLISS